MEVYLSIEVSKLTHTDSYPYISTTLVICLAEKLSFVLNSRVFHQLFAACKHRNALKI